jgi:hypothetical protein
MRLIVIAVLLTVMGCVNSPKNVPAADITARKNSVIYVNMPLDQAEAKLRQFGARPAFLSILLTRKGVEGGRELDHYTLRSGFVLSVTSKPKGSGRIIDQMSVSTYLPKSRESKTDPEYEKFYRSFRACTEYDLELTPDPAAVKSH